MPLPEERRQGHCGLYPEWPARLIPHSVRLQQGAVSTVCRFDDPQHRAPRRIRGDRPCASAEIRWLLLLRHSLATDMLRKGASLDKIGDVLRHRSRVSTTIYAKHDVEGLRSIPSPIGHGRRPGEGGRA